MPERMLADYISRCSDDPALRDAARDLALPEVYAKSFGDLQLDRPIFASANDLSLFAADLREIFSALSAIPEILFGGDRRAYCAALGMDDRLAALLCRGATGRLPVHGRADAYHDGASFRLLEFNVGSELGGTDAAQVNRSWLSVAAFAAFAERWSLSYVDTAARVCEALRAAAARVTSSGEPVVALLESGGGLAAHEHVFLALREAMAQHGVDLLLGELPEIAERNGKITLHGTPVDAILRYFVAGEIAGTSQEEQLDAILRADARDQTVLFTQLEAGLLASKGSLALLHDPELRKSLTSRQAAAIDRVVPWTRLLGTGRSPGDRAGLLDFCRARRGTLVLKPGVGYGAVGTYLGRDTPPDLWNELLDCSAAGDYVVQELVTPAPEPVISPGSGAVEDWWANWGIFLDGGGYAGAFVRALRPGDGSVISYSNPGTRGGCVFACAGDR